MRLQFLKCLAYESNWFIQSCITGAGNSNQHIDRTILFRIVYCDSTARYGGVIAACP